ncbi:MAG: hypothetical protein MUE44_06705 [Oscillatoriaceae cyanobacterium Prado104]|nr:hypothetical protein [Oscillatoriaceae cyanobacterium Prado104]
MKYPRGYYGDSYDRLNVFKYTLASYSVIEWSHVIIYYDLDVSYESRREELKSWIESLFKNPTIYDYRLTHQSQWQEAMEEVFSLEDDDLVWFCCKDNHVFIDYDTDLLYKVEAKLSSMSQDYPYVGCVFSHWPEVLAYSAKPTYNIFPRDSSNGIIIEDADEYCIIKEWSVNDSIYIVNKNWLKYLWCEADYGDTYLPQPDWVPGVRKVPTATIVPYRELFRHFDVYTHVNIDLNLCPPLYIPEGFFENDIKILYCAEGRKPGYVHINPQIEDYYALDALYGVDSRYCLEDLPLFWKNRISTVEVSQEIDRKILLRYRDNALLKLASSRLIHYEGVKFSDLAKRIKFALRSDYYLLEKLHLNPYYETQVNILLNILGETTKEKPEFSNVYQVERISRVAQYCTQEWSGDLIQLGFSEIEATKRLAQLVQKYNRRLFIVGLAEEAETKNISPNLEETLLAEIEPYADVVSIICLGALTEEAIQSIKNLEFCFAFINSFDTYDTCLTAIKTVAHCSGVVAIDNVLNNTEISRAFLQGSEFVAHRSKLYLPLCREAYLLWPSA